MLKSLLEISFRNSLNAPLSISLIAKSYSSHPIAENFRPNDSIIGLIMRVTSALSQADDCVKYSSPHSSSLNHPYSHASRSPSHIKLLPKEFRA